MVDVLGDVVRLLVVVDTGGVGVTEFWERVEGVAIPEVGVALVALWMGVVDAGRRVLAGGVDILRIALWVGVDIGRGGVAVLRIPGAPVEA